MLSQGYVREDKVEEAFKVLNSMSSSYNLQSICTYAQVYYFDITIGGNKL